MRDVKLLPVRSTIKRLKTASLSVAQRVVNLLSACSSSASTCTVLPARPTNASRALASLRMNAAAAESLTFKRLSSVSNVSLLRVLSVRKSLRRWSASASSWLCMGNVCTTSSTWRTGRSAASGASGTTPKAVTPVPSSSAAKLPATRFGCA